MAIQQKKDLTKLGQFLIMGLIGIIIASIVNIFIKSSAMEFAISVTWCFNICWFNCL